MLDILEFLFQDFVHFAGMIVLISTIGLIVGGIIEEIAKAVKK